MICGICEHAKQFHIFLGDEVYCSNCRLGQAGRFHPMHAFEHDHRWQLGPVVETRLEEDEQSVIERATQVLQGCSCGDTRKVLL